MTLGCENRQTLEIQPQKPRQNATEKSCWKEVRLKQRIRPVKEKEQKEAGRKGEELRHGHQAAVQRGPQWEVGGEESRQDLGRALSRPGGLFRLTCVSHSLIHPKPTCAKPCGCSSDLDSPTGRVYSVGSAGGLLLVGSPCLLPQTASVPDEACSPGQRSWPGAGQGHWLRLWRTGILLTSHDVSKKPFLILTSSLKEIPSIKSHEDNSALNIVLIMKQHKTS